MGRAIILFNLLISFIVSGPVEAAVGGRQGNGFVVHCRESSGPEGLLEGFYSLDYLATMGFGANRLVGSWLASAARLTAILRSVLTPSQMDQFEDFVSNFRNTQDYAKRRVWERAPFGVVNLKSLALNVPNSLPPLSHEQAKSNLASLVSELPETCLDGTGSVDLIPAVVFQDHVWTGRPPGYLVYKFVPSIVDKLEANDPLQLSYLLMHEWLWDISNNEDRNRRINHLLHSVRVEEMSPQNLHDQLVGMGLVLDEAPVRVAEALPSFAEPQESLAATEIPIVEAPTAEGFTRWLSGEAGMRVRFKVFTVARECRAPERCGPWEEALPIWAHLRPRDKIGSLIPIEGEFLLGDAENDSISVKFDRVRMGSTGEAIIVTKCSVDLLKTKCNGKWGPQDDAQPAGRVYVNNVPVKLEMIFTKTGIWLGGYGDSGKRQVRFAAVGTF